MVALSIVVLRCIGSSAYIYINHKVFVNHLFFVFLFEFPLAWWLGFKYDKAKFFSQKDALTEVYNRRFLYDIFPRLSARADRSQKKISIFLMDADNFKIINDTYGHRVGDVAIQYVSNILVENTRKCDFVCRWGGDEFLLVAPDTDRESSQVVLQRIEDAIHANEVSKHLPFTVPLSVGLAVYPDDGQELDELIRIADNNMYDHKHTKQSRHGQTAT
jgi:diguanylate cyclase (GGDEF)-like protein